VCNSEVFAGSDQPVVNKRFFVGTVAAIAEERVEWVSADFISAH
jgi:hypothetical protein